MARSSKLFLTGGSQQLISPALSLSLSLSLNNYKESGYFLLIIDPTNDNYGEKLNSPFGLEMRRDENGDPFFTEVKLSLLIQSFLVNVSELMIVIVGLKFP